MTLCELQILEGTDWLSERQMYIKPSILFKPHGVNTS